jgi:hypothetical protein
MSLDWESCVLALSEVRPNENRSLVSRLVKTNLVNLRYVSATGAVWSQMASNAEFLCYIPKMNFLRVMDLQNGAMELLRDHTSTISDVQLVENILISCDHSGAAHMWQLQSTQGKFTNIKLVTIISHSNLGFRRVAVTASRHFAIATDNNSILFFHSDVVGTTLLGSENETEVMTNDTKSERNSSEGNVSAESDIVNKHPPSLSHTDATHILQLESEITSLCFSLDGSYLLAATKNGDLWVWNIPSTHLHLHSQPIGRHSIQDLWFISSSTLIIGSDSNSTLSICDLSTANQSTNTLPLQQSLSLPRGEHSNRIYRIIWDAFRSVLIAASPQSHYVFAMKIHPQTHLFCSIAEFDAAHPIDFISTQMYPSPNPSSLEFYGIHSRGVCSFRATADLCEFNSPSLMERLSATPIKSHSQSNLISHSKPDSLSLTVTSLLLPSASDSQLQSEPDLHLQSQSDSHSLSKPDLQIRDDSFSQPQHELDSSLQSEQNPQLLSQSDLQAQPQSQFEHISPKAQLQSQTELSLSPSRLDQADDVVVLTEEKKHEFLCESIPKEGKQPICDDGIQTIDPLPQEVNKQEQIASEILQLDRNSPCEILSTKCIICYSSPSKTGTSDPIDCLPNLEDRMESPDLFVKTNDENVQDENHEVIHEVIHEENQDEDQEVIHEEIHEDILDENQEIIHEEIHEEIQDEIHEEIQDENREVIHEKIHDDDEVIHEEIHEEIQDENQQVIHEEIQDENQQVIHEEIQDENQQVIHEEIHEEILDGNQDELKMKSHEDNHDSTQDVNEVKIHEGGQDASKDANEVKMHEDGRDTTQDESKDATQDANEMKTHEGNQVESQIRTQDDNEVKTHEGGQDANEDEDNQDATQDENKVEIIEGSHDANKVKTHESNQDTNEDESEDTKLCGGEFQVTLHRLTDSGLERFQQTNLTQQDECESKVNVSITVPVSHTPIICETNEVKKEWESDLSRAPAIPMLPSPLIETQSHQDNSVPEMTNDGMGGAPQVITPRSDLKEVTKNRNNEEKKVEIGEGTHSQSNSTPPSSPQPIVTTPQKNTKTMCTAMENAYNEGLVAEKKKNYTEAYALYLIAAKEGNTRARTNLATLLLFGYGVEKDPIKANKLLRKSAAEGHVRAMRSLAQQYRTGVGVAKDEKAAAYWQKMWKRKEAEERGKLKGKKTVNVENQTNEIVSGNKTQLTEPQNVIPQTEGKPPRQSRAWGSPKKRLSHSKEKQEPVPLTPLQEQLTSQNQPTFTPSQVPQTTASSSPDGTKFQQNEVSLGNRDVSLEKNGLPFENQTDRISSSISPNTVSLVGGEVVPPLSVPESSSLLLLETGIVTLPKPPFGSLGFVEKTNLCKVQECQVNFTSQITSNDRFVCDVVRRHFIRALNFTTGKYVLIRVHQAPVTDLRLASVDILGSCDLNGVFYLYNLVLSPDRAAVKYVTKARIEPDSGESSSVCSFSHLSLHPSISSVFALARADNSVLYFDLEKSNLKDETKSLKHSNALRVCGLQSPVTSLSFSPGGTLLIVAEMNGQLSLWEPLRNRTQRFLPYEGLSIGSALLVSPSIIVTTNSCNGQLDVWKGNSDVSSSNWNLCQTLLLPQQTTPYRLVWDDARLTLVIGNSQSRYLLFLTLPEGNASFFHGAGTMDVGDSVLYFGTTMTMPSTLLEQRNTHFISVCVIQSQATSRFIVVKRPERFVFCSEMSISPLIQNTILMRIVNEDERPPEANSTLVEVNEKTQVSSLQDIAVQVVAKPHEVKASSGVKGFVEVRRNGEAKGDECLSDGAESGEGKRNKKKRKPNKKGNKTENEETRNKGQGGFLVEESERVIGIAEGNPPSVATPIHFPNTLQIQSPAHTHKVFSNSTPHSSLPTSLPLPASLPLPTPSLLPPPFLPPTTTTTTTTTTILTPTLTHTPNHTLTPTPTPTLLPISSSSQNLIQNETPMPFPPQITSNSLLSSLLNLPQHTTPTSQHISPPLTQPFSFPNITPHVLPRPSEVFLPTPVDYGQLLRNTEETIKQSIPLLLQESISAAISSQKDAIIASLLTQSQECLQKTFEVVMMESVVSEFERAAKEMFRQMDFAFRSALSEQQTAVSQHIHNLLRSHINEVEAAHERVREEFTRRVAEMMENIRTDRNADCERV